MNRWIALGVLCAAAARGEEIDYKRLYSSVSPAVVLIYGEEGDTGSVGTGSIIHKSGLVVTNAHVILNHATQKPFGKLFIFLKPDKVTGSNEHDLKRGYHAQILAWNAAKDLAVLLIDGAPAGLPTVLLAEADVGVGEATAAIGHPEHGARWSLTTGRIGGEWDNFEGVTGKDVYQMETSVNRGNSGGPLLDGNGYMVGINTAIARRSEDGLAITGINFAIKSSVVRGWLGEVLSQLEPKKRTVAEPPPPPPAVAAAEPPPLEPERKEDAVTPSETEISAQARKGETPSPGVVRVSAPPPPPPGQRGFSSSEKPGRVLSPQEVVRLHAAKAFDDLEREEQKHKH
ncbi:MAG: S1C family serine protease [Myxococcales bacterium]|nr:trypsin-like peptidase domain-containing protein [Myxococcales bacterium]